MIRKILTLFFHQEVFLGFIWITLGWALVYDLFVGHFAAAFVVALTLFFTFVPSLLKRRYHIELPRAVALFGVFFAYATLFLGEIHGFYERFWWWDIFLHGGSAIMLGLIGLGIIRMMLSAETLKTSAGMTSLFGFAFALAIGVLWEIVEFTIDRFFGTHMQLGSLVDTMSDLIVDALGAAIVVFLAYLHWRYRDNFIGRVIEGAIARYGYHD